ncbi:MAG TPA: DNA methyltransferase [Ignavibacteria bacterium]
MSSEKLDDIIKDFQIGKFTQLFREKNRDFKPREENLERYNDDLFKEGLKLGEIIFSDTNKLIVCGFKVKRELSERSCKKLQYDKSRKILKEERYDSGIFIFYDSDGNFRFSLVYAIYLGNRRDWNNFRRFTYYVNKKLTNKTFLKQIGSCDFSSNDKIKGSFSITAVTDLFYKEFFDEHFTKMVDSLIEKFDLEDEKARDFVLLFCIRIIFIGFIQKRKWIGKDELFILNFFKEYEIKFYSTDKFYEKWLTPLFFEALNNPPGRKVAYQNNEFSKETEESLQLAPYLNGGLFKKKTSFDDESYYLPDKDIKNFFEFLFSHSFTIEENSFEDEDLQLNPEFLGIIFERLVNKENGAVYTPRTEVDFMCRLSLVKWLEKNTSKSIQKNNLYELFFREIGDGKDTDDIQKEGSFSKKEIEEIISLLENISICDPAVGSGAFLVGMLLILDEIILNLKQRIGAKYDDSFERKKNIIANSLYGVEVQEWAVWICQLRLWISLFIDAPEDMKDSQTAILPSLDFKVRQGDSLVQRIGSKMFPVTGHAQLTKSIKDKVTKLKNIKVDYFLNKSDFGELIVKQNENKLFIEIINEEIYEIKDTLKKKKGKEKVEKINLFHSDISEQEVIEYNKEEISELENLLNELETQKSLITENKPLIWNIEFAEIFVEKNGFDLIIGNPPYVRHEDIEDPTGKIKDKKEYKSLLEEMVRIDYPDYFRPKIKINAKSDLYIYFYLRSLKLLNKNGYHCFICSNSWLDVGYGAWFQKFLLDKAPIDFIIDNHSKRSFESADINTIISFINAPQKQVTQNHYIKFVAFKKPFEETIFTEYLLDIDNTKSINNGENYRVYPITNNDLLSSGTEYDSDEQEKLNMGKFIGDKWGGKYLRAPFFMQKYFKSENLIKFNDLIDIKYGLKTGKVKFFYIKDEIIKEFNIEKEFYHPIITTSQDLDTLFVESNEFLFNSNLSKFKLKGTGALEYIKYGENNNMSIGSSVESHRPYWYSLSFEVVDILFFRFWDKRFWSPITKYKTTCSDNFCYGNFKTNEWSGKLIVNSTFYFLQIELFGRDNQGQGVLTTYMEFDYPFIRMPILNNDDERYKSILYNLDKRKIKTLFEECGINPKSEIPIEEQEPNPLPDRAELDKIVFDALELTEEERKEVYRAVCRLVWNRISKAKSV